MERSTRTRMTARNQKRESRASLDLFMNGILAGEIDGAGQRKSRHVGAGKYGSMIDAQPAAGQGGRERKHERRRRHRAPPVRGADRATTSGGDASGSCRIEASVEQATAVPHQWRLGQSWPGQLQASIQSQGALSPFRRVLISPRHRVRAQSCAPSIARLAVPESS
jgi:hypothetical protein